MYSKSVILYVMDVEMEYVKGKNMFILGCCCLEVVFLFECCILFVLLIHVFLSSYVHIVVIYVFYFRIFHLG